MKWMLPLLFVLAFPALAAERDILKCLGQEEKSFHLTKKMGPLYELNQRIMSEIIQIPHVELSTEAFHEICQVQKKSPSLMVLKHSLAEGKAIFKLPTNLDNMNKQMTIGMIDDYVEASKEIFLNFISQVQTQAPTPTCLEDQIKGLKDLLIQIKYLQEDVDTKDILKGKDLQVFDRLEHYQKIFEACAQDLRKKKLKSESTSEAKKR